jgi:hypothetical protein
VASDGTPVTSGLLFTPKYIPDGIEFKGGHRRVRAGWFEVPGCEPGEKVGVWVYDPQRKEGGHAEFVVGAGGAPTLRLSKCVSGKVRVVDPAGKPVRGAYLTFELVLRPGEDPNESALSGRPAGLGVPETALYGWGLVPTDRGDGTYALKDLIPGAAYAIKALTASSFSERLTFTAPKSGVQDLGDLVLDPRPAGKQPTASATVGQPYLYQAEAVDPDGDPITFDLVQGPAGMRFDPQTNVVHWVPGPKQVGTHQVVIRASDSYGGTAIQRWQLTVAAAGGN